MTNVPITVLTGFLGSGKTTLLSRLLKDPALAGTAVIINEFGEIGLDHDLVESADEQVVELSSGCLCCTIRGDLVETLSDLMPRLNPAQGKRITRVVVETTGLADPAPIIHTLMSDQRLALGYRLDGVVTLVDAVNGESTLDNHYEAVKQAAVADRLVLTKTDLIEDVSGLEARLRDLNPAAPMLHAATLEPMSLFNCGLYNAETKSTDVKAWLREEAYAEDHHHDHDHGHHHHHGHDHGHDHDHDHGHGQDHHHHHHDSDHDGHNVVNPARFRHGHDVNRHGDDIEAYCLVRETPISGFAFQFFLDVLTSHHGEDLLRVKGILNIAEQPGRPAVIHGVQHVFHPVHWMEEWPSDDQRSRLVFITKGIPKEKIDKLLSALDAQVDNIKAEA